MRSRHRDLLNRLEIIGDRMEGKIVKIEEERGFGFIGAGGEQQSPALSSHYIPYRQYFFHATDVRHGQFANLYLDQIVVFTPCNDPEKQKTRAIDICDRDEAEAFESADGA